MRSALRRKARRGQQIVDVKPQPAPTGGWDAVSPIGNMKPDRALVLDNWFPTPADVRVRRGFQTHTADLGSGVVESLLCYHGVTNATSKLFAGANNTIYDVTSEGNPSASVTGLSNNRWQSVNFTTVGGHFLWICNGTDAPRHYNGSTWAMPSLTISTFAADEIINVNAHKNRLWFVFRDSTVAGYLPVNVVAGTVSNFDLGQQFTRGGYLVAMATWTRDAGSGPDDYAVFFSSKGQVAVYQGTDPSSANTWAIVGTFDLGSPIGNRCFAKVAGDVALVNIDGVLPLSQALQQDRGAAAAIAITKNINNAMNVAARNYGSNFGWELIPYPKGTYVLLNVPIREGVEQHQYVMNTLTGAWCRFKGQNANCWAVFLDDLYFGGNDGSVYRADQTAMDKNEVIDAVGQTAYNYYGSSGQLKQWKLVQPIITTNSATRPAIGISTDFKSNAVLGTPSTSQDVEAQYDSAVYDSSVYAIEGRTVADPVSVSGEGYCASVHFRVQTGNSGVSVWGESEWSSDTWSPPVEDDVDMQLNGFNSFYERGLAL